MSRFQIRAARAAAIAAGLLLGQGGPAALAQHGRDSVETVVAPPFDEDAETRTERVAIARDELAGQEGRRAVMERINRAVRRVCLFDETSTLADRAAYELCSQTSLADAEGQLRVLLAGGATGPLQVALAGTVP